MNPYILSDTTSCVWRESVSEDGQAPPRVAPNLAMDLKIEEAFATCVVCIVGRGAFRRLGLLVVGSQFL
jgi:hypothetical protein